ncbi:MAG: PAS domain-containing protein [Coriobacteriia bacterium]|nr:PAS domain-containing protein [Coriobacteriia bacterium]
MEIDAGFLAAVLDHMPVGVIAVDDEGRVVAWNGHASDFIACVERPSLYRGMTLDDAHPENSRRGMSAMVDALRSGRTFPARQVVGRDGSRFQVSYHALSGADDGFLGIAQIIEPTPGASGGEEA